METKNLNYEEKVKILNQIFKENQMGTIDRTTVVDGGDECVLLLEDSISLLYDFVFDAGRRKKGFDKNKGEIEGLLNIIHVLCKKGAASKYSNLNRNYKAILVKRPVKDSANPYCFSDTCFDWIENIKKGLNQLSSEIQGETQKNLLQQGLDACDEMEAILPRIWDNCSKDAYKYAKEFIEIMIKCAEALQNKDFTLIDQFTKAKELLLKWENCRKEVGKLFSSVDVSKETSLDLPQDKGFKFQNDTKLELIKEAIDEWEQKAENRQLPCYVSYDMTQKEIDSLQGELAVEKQDLKKYKIQYKNGNKSSSVLNGINDLVPRIKKQEQRLELLEAQLRGHRNKIDISLEVLKYFKFYYKTLLQSGQNSDFFKAYVDYFNIAQLNRMMNPFQITHEDISNFRAVVGRLLITVDEYNAEYGNLSDEYLEELHQIENKPLELGGLTTKNSNKNKDLSEDILAGMDEILSEDDSLDDEDISLDDDEDEIEIRIKKDVVDDD